MLPHVDSEEAKRIVTRLQRLLLRASSNGGRPVTVSLGSVTFSRPPESITAMIERVDRLMYSVKKGGKNGVAFEVWPTPVSVPRLRATRLNPNGR